MDRRRELEETFELVVANNEQMARDIIKDLEPINEGLQESNRKFEINNKMQRKPPRIGGKRKQESKYGPLARGSTDTTSIRMGRWIRGLVYAMKIESPDWRQTYCYCW